MRAQCMSLIYFLYCTVHAQVAIVAPTPGTTRDCMEVALDLGGLKVSQLALKRCLASLGTGPTLRHSDTQADSHMRVYPYTHTHANQPGARAQDGGVSLHN